jgi:hypothetical protein
MLKLIPFILSLTLISAGGVAISAQKISDNTASANLQIYMRANDNLDSSMQYSSDLFLRANTNPNLQ